jgi:hypothetical protein
MLSLPVMAFLGVFDKHQIVEEPDEFNDSRPVLKTSRWGDLPAEFTLVEMYMMNRTKDPARNNYAEQKSNSIPYEDKLC